MILEGDLTPQQIVEKVGGYQAFLPDDAMIEHEGKQVKLRDLPDIRNAKDLPTLAKNYIESQREIGRRVRIPGKDAKPEELQGFKAKLYEAGIFSAPLGSPQDYGIVRPEAIAEELWNPELANSLASVLHKYGIPKEAAPELLALHEQSLTGAKNVLNTSLEAGMSALKTEHGDKFDERMELAKRIAPTIFRTEEEIAFAERTGLANHPGLLGLIMRLAPLAQQDSSFMAGLQRPGGEMTGDAVRVEITKIMSDPNHPMYQGYWKQDKAVMAHVEELYKRAYGNAQVVLT